MDLDALDRRLVQLTDRYEELTGRYEVLRTELIDLTQERDQEHAENMARLQARQEEQKEELKQQIKALEKQIEEKERLDRLQEKITNRFAKCDQVIGAMDQLISRLALATAWSRIEISEIDLLI